MSYYDRLNNTFHLRQWRDCKKHKNSEGKRYLVFPITYFPSAGTVHALGLAPERRCMIRKKPAKKNKE